ncbi:MAG TPA: two-component regulator propeller domain-containing protein, partial [Balneolaceae bacterium]|nr:two-component regulator propeller domain-containing protein [Balneolaceae bacterium]
MKINILLACIIVIVAGIFNITAAQTMPFRSYSIENGLSESVIHSMIQDEMGFIWLGTGFGLNRFDGVEFKKWYEEDGLPNNRVNALLQSSEDKIWIGTDAGLAYLENDSIYSPDIFEPVLESVVLSIYEDTDGAIWVATEGNGLWKYKTSGEFTNVSTQHGYRHMMARTVVEDSQQVIWVGTSEGLFSYDGTNFKKHRSSEGIPEVSINEMKISDSQELWMATDAGLIKKLGDTVTIYDAEWGLNDDKLYSLSFVDDGVWVGSESGASFFDGNTFENYTSENGLNAKIVYETMIDREHNVWLGTLGGGANMFLGELFKNYSVDTGLANNMVVGFEEDHLGNIWIVTYGGGIHKYDGKDFEHFSQADGLVDDKAYVITEDSRNRLWVGTRNGISIYENGTFRTIPDDVFPFKWIRDIYEDESTGEYWIATYNSGVIRFDGESYEQYNTSSGLLSNTVMDIKKDDRGRMIFATYGGVAILENGTFEHITIADGLPNNGVIHVYIDHDGTLWFSTFSGIASYDGNSLRAISTDTQSNTISYYMLQDEEDRYWVGTNRGIYLFNPEQFFSSETQVEQIKSFKLFDQNQGLVANELNAGGALVASDHTIWLGTVEGLSHFFPSRIDSNTTPPGIVFEEILMSGQSQNSYSNNVFGHDENFLQISYTGLSFSSPSQILYEYRLSGLEDEWQTTRSRTVRYTSLPPGDYSFRIRAYNADGIRSTEEARFEFVINQPVWLQWWFLALTGLAVIGLIVFYYRHFRAKKQIDIERMRVQIASDLHDDVGSSLTELALQTDFLQAGEVSDELRDTLKQLGDQSRKIVTSLDDIVWSIDARNDTAGD